LDDADYGDAAFATFKANQYAAPSATGSQLCGQAIFLTVFVSGFQFCYHVDKPPWNAGGKLVSIESQ